MVVCDFSSASRKKEAEVKVRACPKQHPRLIRALPPLLGYRTDGSEADLHARTRLSTVVAFAPALPLSVGNV